MPLRARNSVSSARHDRPAAWSGPDRGRHASSDRFRAETLSSLAGPFGLYVRGGPRRPSASRLSAPNADVCRGGATHDAAGVLAVLSFLRVFGFSARRLLAVWDEQLRYYHPPVRVVRRRARPSDDGVSERTTSRNDVRLSANRARRRREAKLPFADHSLSSGHISEYCRHF